MRSYIMRLPISRRNKGEVTPPPRQVPPTCRTCIFWALETFWVLLRSRGISILLLQ